MSLATFFSFVHTIRTSRKKCLKSCSKKSFDRTDTGYVSSTQRETLSFNIPIVNVVKSGILRWADHVAKTDRKTLHVELWRETSLETDTLEAENTVGR
jgi:hypothetical protein